jgi:hypothetical protein
MQAEQALIAEARARARRRRQKIALAVTAAAAALSAAGVLITLTVPGKPHKIDAITPSAGPAIQTGTVTGHLTACYGAVPPGTRSPVTTPGTVTAVRGTVSLRPMGPGTWRSVLPTGPVVAQAHISDNYHQVFRFALPPGTYVLLGRYDDASYAPGTATTFTQVSVIAGKTLHADLISACK